MIKLTSLLLGIISLFSFSSASPSKVAGAIPLELIHADTLVICDFTLPDGHVVTDVLSGVSNLLGQNWNSDFFPQAPILIYEVSADHIGDSDRATIVNTTGFYHYDKDTGTIYQIALDGSKVSVITLSKLKAAL